MKYMIKDVLKVHVFLVASSSLLFGELVKLYFLSLRFLNIIYITKMSHKWKMILCVKISFEICF